MKIIPKPILNLFVLCLTSLCFCQQWQAEPVQSKYFKRLYKLSDSIYRSEQPSKKGFSALDDMGFKTVLNLRRLKEDYQKAKHTDLELQHIRLTSKSISQADLVKALRVLRDAEKPLLIHCWHGSDRTGVVSAAYRIVFQNWTKDEAIAELRQPQFGHHEEWYPNIVELLHNLNVRQMRILLGLKR